MTEKAHEKVLYSFKKTRKAYLVEYALGVLFLFLPSILILKGFDVNKIIGNFFFVLGLVSMLSAEYSRIITRYKFTPEKIVITHGIVKQKKKNVYFAPLAFLPNINFKQGRMQRLLNYGDVYISSGAGDDNNFKIEDVSKPHRILQIIEELVHKGRDKVHEGMVEEGEELVAAKVAKRKAEEEKRKKYAKNSFLRESS